MAKRAKDKEERRRLKAARQARQAGVSLTVNAGAPVSSPASSPTKQDAPAAVAAAPTPVPATPIAFLFPGQGSQAVGMLKVHLMASSFRPHLPSAWRAGIMIMHQACCHSPRTTCERLLMP